MTLALAFVPITCRSCAKVIATTDGIVVRVETERGGYMETDGLAVVRCHRRRIVKGEWAICGTMNRLRPGELAG